MFDKKGLHLVAWDRISLPRSLGGWGVQNLFWVSQDLHLKILWRALTHAGLWGCILRDKYLKGASVTECIRSKRKSTVGVSNSWRALILVFPLLLKHLAWVVGDGFQVRVGIDPIVGCHLFLSVSTLAEVRQRGIIFLNQAKSGCLMLLPTTGSKHAILVYLVMAERNGTFIFGLFLILESGFQIRLIDLCGVGMTPMGRLLLLWHTRLLPRNTLRRLIDGGSAACGNGKHL